ncbi:Gfo/Idh/MocA family protein [Thermoanaerobacterium thermosaccharolyticum]|uniref:Gfo/Idh/MocA family protein n=1 Tax=Thermoanaerobacterium thermosaccharolyticum TaxID=1517 RepID=UPI003DA912EC
MPIKLGIIGYGGMGMWHHKNAPKVKGVDVVATYDIDAYQVDVAKKAGLRGYHKLDEFLKDEEINTVLIATPNDVHKDLAVASANAGKNVIVEKPVAMSMKEIDEIIEAAEKNNVVFTVHQNRRWDKDFNKVKKAVELGMIGDVYTIESRVHGAGGLIYGWRNKKECGGGMLLDWGVHLIDQILYMIPNKVVRVYAELFSVLNKDVDDYFKLLMKFDNGLSAQIEVGTFCLKPLPRWFVGGNKGTLVVDDFEGHGEIVKLNKLADKFDAEIVETTAGPTRTFAPRPEEVKDHFELPDVNSEWIEFYANVRDTIEGKAELIVKPDEVKRVYSIIEAAFKLNQLGKAVEL